MLLSAEQASQSDTLGQLDSRSQERAIAAYNWCHYNILTMYDHLGLCNWSAKTHEGDRVAVVPLGSFRGSDSC